MSDSEADKAKLDQEKGQESEPLSAYGACVLRESNKVCELMAEARREADLKSESIEIYLLN